MFSRLTANSINRTFASDWADIGLAVVFDAP